MKHERIQMTSKSDTSSSFIGELLKSDVGKNEREQEKYIIFLPSRSPGSHSRRSRNAVNFDVAIRTSHIARLIVERSRTSRVLSVAAFEPLYRPLGKYGLFLRICFYSSSTRTFDVNGQSKYKARFVFLSLDVSSRLLSLPRAKHASTIL